MVADALSRSVSSVSVDLFDLPSIAEMQASDSEILQYSDRLKEFELGPSLRVWCDVSTEIPRPFIPKQGRFPVFTQLHCFSHPGVKGSLELITRRYFWPSMNKEIKQRVKECLDCQCNGIQNRPYNTAVSRI